jgi:glycosyltransferase involved in cell wall biosynthesis
LKKIVYIGNNLPSTNPTTFKQLIALLKELGFRVYGYSHKKMSFVRLIHMCWGIIKHRKATYVLIDTYSTLNFYYALITSQIARLFHISYIPIVHGGNLPKRLLKNPRLSHLLFSNATKIVTPSLYLKDAFEKMQLQTILIPNAIAIQKYHFKKRAQLQPKLLWVRAFDQIYNPLLAVEVLALLKNKFPQASLCMIGPDKDGSIQEVKKKATLLGVADALEITGLLSKEEWIIKAAAYDIFLNTTNIDNIPVSVIEAMALGLPVISTDVGGMPYLIDSYKNGILVPSNNAVKMMDAIEELLHNPLLVTKITLEAKKRILNYDTKKVQQQWKNLLN